MYIQFKKGILELCALSMLEKNDCYGYDIANKLVGVIDVAEGSVYPVLRRLKLDNYVTSYLAETSGGPPRKYYAITNEGKVYLSELKTEWNRLSNSMYELIAKGDVG